MFDPKLHHRHSVRLKGWDYREAGRYVVTVCTHEKSCLFSQIKEGKIELTELGKIVHDEWTNAARIRADVRLDEFIIMPNHLHGILILREDPKKRSGGEHSTLVSGSLGAIIGQFKSSVTKQAGESMGLASFKVWHRGYFERIIRDDVELFFVQDYIATNPSRWEQGIKLGSFRRGKK